MANLFYPQLTSGALAQYPLRKTRITRTIKNILSDGSMILLPDSDARRTIWQLEYSNLSFADVQLLQSHFTACKGPLSAFTFIDPTGNMLASSTDLTNAVWQKSSLLQIQTDTADPLGGTTGQTITNYGQSAQELAQTLEVPANYQYCFSLYAAAVAQIPVTLFQRGPNTEQSKRMFLSSGWNRLTVSGRLNDSGSSMTVGASLDAGTQIKVFGMQLEAQISPSRYQPTTITGGVYANAHWAIEQFQITAEDINLYATTVSIETAA
ncbi:MAG: hypothetical protein JO185_19670 [Acidobacteriaceae bacterium]|nr:hypothetical protein [Acidobacteriaceae bacterium]